MTRDEFLEQVRANPLPVVVDVWAAWCMPCRRMAPALDRIGKEFGGRVDLYKLDTGRDPELARELGVLGVPTVIVYLQGRELARRVGAQSEEGLRAMFTAAESGLLPTATGLPGSERMLRLGAAAVLAVAGWAAGPSLLILAIAGLVFFSGVYDRCPVWRALAPRLGSLLRRQSERPGTSSG